MIWLYMWLSIGGPPNSPQWVEIGGFTDERSCAAIVASDIFRGPFSCTSDHKPPNWVPESDRQRDGK